MKRIIILLVSVLIISACTANRKLQAAAILRQCKVELGEIQFQGFMLDSNLFPNSKSTDDFPNSEVLPLVQKLFNGKLERPLGHFKLGLTLHVRNLSKDTLWLHSLNGIFALDSIVESPVLLTKSSVLVPGYSEMQLQATLPLDQSLFQLTQVQNYRIQGAAEASLASEDEGFILEFDEKRPIPSGKIDSLLTQAKQSLIEQVLSNWVGSLM